MKRGELYRVCRGSKNDPKEHRVFLIVSRQMLIDSNFSTVICAPVYSKYDGFPTQIEVGTNVKTTVSVKRYQTRAFENLLYF